VRTGAPATPYWQAAPLAAVFAGFLVFPLAAIVVASVWDYENYRLVPTFVLRNYAELFSARVTYITYLHTAMLAALAWACTLVLGFTLAYFLAFHVRTTTWRTVLFLVCTIPFWTSNVIRMISWIPFLGRHGIVNGVLLRLGLVDQPLEFLLFSDFAAVLAFVHLYTLFMVVPIFNSMIRIDRSLLEAAVDAGASGWGVVREIVIPLAKPGIAIGSIFVISLVMGDFVTVRLMGGGKSAAVGLMLANSISLLQYPQAAAGAVVLLAAVLTVVTVILRTVDIRKEL
jgi:putative spermidine/putrescine transport system permease protein